VRAVPAREAPASAASSSAPSSSSSELSSDLSASSSAVRSSSFMPVQTGRRDMRVRGVRPAPAREPAWARGGNGRRTQLLHAREVEAHDLFERHLLLHEEVGEVAQVVALQPLGQLCARAMRK
jgi:hypothetical protein